jgi:transcriptional regulator with XRE-family HTH domain
MESLRVRLGQAVRELRSAAGFSQESFAAKAKVHRTFMGTIERGETNVSLDTLERIARGLDMGVWELVRKAEAMGSRRGGTYGRQKGEREAALLKKVAEEKSR